MKPINLTDLRIDNLIMFFSAVDEKWIVARITAIGLNYITLKALEGEMAGWTWNENLARIQDPEHYRTYIPEPPKRKFRPLRNLLKRLGWI